jgi:hypothetical protein
MFIVKILVLVLHVASAALLFGASLGVPRMAKNALATNDEAFKLAAKEGEKRGKLSLMAAGVTLVTGIGLIFINGGFAAVTKNYHMSLLLLLAALAFSFAWIKPNTARLMQAASKSPVDKGAAETAIGKLTMGSGVLQTLWLTILFLMFYPF